MRNKNVWIILAAVVLIALVGVLAMVVKPDVDISGDALPVATQPPADEGEATGTDVATDTDIATGTDIATITDAAPVPQSYLLVTVGNTTYRPLGLYTEGVFTLSQGEDGTVVNAVHVTPTSVWMESSTCDNQDCVEQGVVSLDTMNDRVLGNMIICLPHQVTLQLYTVEEMEALIASLEGEAAQ